MNLEARIDVLERQIASLRREVREITERLDTVLSAPWKRVWWLLLGWRWYGLGRWYGG